jgi:hypothetical protein
VLRDTLPVEVGENLKEFVESGEACRLAKIDNIAAISFRNLPKCLVAWIDGMFQTSTAPGQVNTMDAVVRAFDIGVSRELVKKLVEVDDVSRLPVVLPPMEKHYNDQVFVLLC